MWGLLTLCYFSGNFKFKGEDCSVSTSSSVCTIAPLGTLSSHRTFSLYVHSPANISRCLSLFSSFLFWSSQSTFQEARLRDPKHYTMGRSKCLRRCSFDWRTLNEDCSRFASGGRAELQEQENRIPLLYSWNSALPPLPNLLQSSFNVLQSNEHLRRHFDLPIVSYRRPKNLRDLLVSTSGSVAGSSGPKADGTFPCETSRCKTCEAVHNLDTVDCKEPYKIRGHFTCASSSVVYLISCGKPGCEAVYAGRPAAAYAKE